MKKVLIIGSQGTLGQELVRIFSADENYKTFGWDLKEIDVTDESSAMEKIIALTPAIVINAAAYNAVDKAEDVLEFEKAKRLNGLAPKYLAQAAKNIGAVFVQYSTDYVFDGKQKEGYEESDEPSPVLNISNYGFSKLMGERQVKRVGGQYYIIRLQKLFGLLSPKCRPANSPASKKSFFETMLDLAQVKKELEVVDEELANFTYAPDLARQTKYLIECGYIPGIYHITSEGNPVTWFGAAKILFGLAGIDNVKLIPVSSDKFPRPAKRPKYSILLNTKLPPLRSWSEALKESLGK